MRNLSRTNGWTTMNEAFTVTQDAMNNLYSRLYNNSSVTSTTIGNHWDAGYTYYNINEAAQSSTDEEPVVIDVRMTRYIDRLGFKISIYYSDGNSEIMDVEEDVGRRARNVLSGEGWKLMGRRKFRKFIYQLTGKQDPEEKTMYNWYMINLFNEQKNVE